MRVTLGCLALALAAAPASAFVAQPAAFQRATFNAASRSILRAKPTSMPTMLAGEGMRARMLPAARSSALTAPKCAAADSSSPAKGGLDLQLVLYFALWYLSPPRDPFFRT
jgi:hypothetical protein